MMRERAYISLSLALLGAIVLGCVPSGRIVTPSITITDPPSGATVMVGEQVQILSTSAADAGIERVELSIDGRLERTDRPPEGNPTVFFLDQPWTPMIPGQVTVSVVAYDLEGASSEAATIFLEVLGEAGATTVTPGDSGSGSVTPTPAEDVPGSEDCTLNAAFVADVTVPDEAEIAPGASFTKTWRIRNTGTCDWEAGFKLVFSSQDRMDGPDSVTVADTAAGSTADISVDLIAPTAPGTYRGNWQMEAVDGTRFGSIVMVKIVVPALPAATATASPAAVCTPPACGAGEVLYCPGSCPGGCGVICATPSPSCVPADPALQPVLDHAGAMGYDLGCPTAAASTIGGAFQEFWVNVDAVNPHLHFRSLMIWRSDNREIYVIDGDNTDASAGALLAYTDTWEESQPHEPPGCTAMTVPTGYLLPVRGFGKVWCVNDLDDEVGWPAEPEAAVTLLVQPTQYGLLLKVSGPISVGYVIALDYRAVRAVTLMSSP